VILEDQLVRVRLKHQSEFVLRLHEVLTNWSLNEKPGLVVQARPAENGALDLTAVKVRTTLREGIEADDRPNFWDHFEAISMLYNVHGITGTVSTDTPRWLTEVHRDGHMLAGVWDFPEVPVRGGHTAAAIAYWYASFFEEWFKLMANVAAAGGLSGEFLVTATLVNANLLRYGARNPANQAVVSGEQCLMQNVQWSVQGASIGSAEWHTLGKAMALGIAGAYRVPMR
jgi:hypothetical protein